MISKLVIKNVELLSEYQSLINEGSKQVFFYQIKKMNKWPFENCQ